MLTYWIYSKGKLNISYPMQALCHIGFLIVETIVALRDPAQYSIFLFHILNVWGVAMNIKGYLRLKWKK